MYTSYYNGKCSVSSPDGKLGCTQMVGHQNEGNVFCSNTIEGKNIKWCGYCHTFDTNHCKHAISTKKMVSITNWDAMPFILYCIFSQDTKFEVIREIVINGNLNLILKMPMTIPSYDNQFFIHVNYTKYI